MNKQLLTNHYLVLFSLQLSADARHILPNQDECSNFLFKITWQERSQIPAPAGTEWTVRWQFKRITGLTFAAWSSSTEVEARSDVWSSSRGTSSRFETLVLLVTLRTSQAFVPIGLSRHLKSFSIRLTYNETEFTANTLLFKISHCSTCQSLPSLLQEHSL